MMNKLLVLLLLLTSCSSEVYAETLVDFTKLIPPQPQVIYVVPVQQYALPVSIVPSTYVAPSSNWNVTVPPPPVVNLGVGK
jgi:hypothetical protein